MANDLKERMRTLAGEAGVGGFPATEAMLHAGANRIEELEKALEPFVLFADAEGRMTPDYGEVSGRDFQMMTMHPDPEGLSSDLRRAARALKTKEPK